MVSLVTAASRILEVVVLVRWQLGFLILGFFLFFSMMDLIEISVGSQVNCAIGIALL